MSSESLRSVCNVVELRRKEMPNANDFIGLSDRELQIFLKVCDKLRNLGDRNTAVVTITEHQLKIDTQHFGSMADDGKVVLGQILCLSSIMSFEVINNTEDLKRMIGFVSEDSLPEE